MPFAELNFRHLLPRLADRIVAADPAGSRLRVASRTLMALALTSAVLFGIGRLTPLPIASYGLGMLLSFIGTIGIRDSGWRRQIVTRVIATLVATAAAVLAGALAPWPVAADLGFLVVIFLSVYIRRYGMRWLSVGMVAFMAYFMGEYLHPLPSDAAYLLLAAVVALSSAQIASVLVLPDNPELDFRRAMRTIDHRTKLILDQLLQSAETGGLPQGNRAVIRRQMWEFREIVLMAEGFVPQISGDNWLVTGAAADLGAALVDLLLAVERLVRYSQTALPQPKALRALIKEYGPNLRARDLGSETEDAGATMRLLEAVRQARSQINVALGPSPSAAFSETTTATSMPQHTVPTVPRAGVPESFHRPIQVTLACSLALLVGYALSPTRWYWAVITAYIVFSNTRTRADTALRALNRSAGTIGGVLAGTLLATLLQGHGIASGVLISVMFFLAVYNLQTSYGWMVFFFTVSLALLYGLMGMFTPNLLFVRLFETLVGGICGVAAAFLVFPLKTGREVEAAFTGFLDSLGKLVAAAASRAAGEAPALTSAALRLDRSYGALVTAVRPLGGPWAAVTRFGTVRTKLLLLVSCSHWARVLASALTAGQPMGFSEQARIAELVAAIDEKLARLQLSAGRWFEAAPIPELDTAPLPVASFGDLTRDAVIGAFTTIDELLGHAVAQIKPI